MNRRSALIVAGLCSLVVGCANKPAARAVSNAPLTAGQLGGVRVSDEIARLCKIQLGNADRAPKFDYDDASLLTQDRDVLEQVAKCMTTGPLKGRHLGLVGRADPRGESEYNMILASHRAGSVKDFLAKLGVAPDAISQTSRGELDAEGTDEESYKRDRRVDLTLLAVR